MTPIAQRPQVFFDDLGSIDYQAAYNYQNKLVELLTHQKLANWHHNAGYTLQNTLIFCEHNHVYTLGKSGKIENLLLNNGELNNIKAQFFKIDRGGDITYHGAGQLVGYPIFDLEQLKPDLTWYIYSIEEAIIRSLAHFGLMGARVAGATGVWLDAHTPHARKICAIGVKNSRWITKHGFAFNINTNINYFKHIVPCGIDDKGVTSLHLELGAIQDFDAVKQLVKQEFASVFGIEYQEI
jgi:lipoyl(octanoyl) transferase